MPQDRIDLVFEGGGVKGVGLAGAAGRLTTRGFRPRYVGGSSAGAVVAALYSAGYTDEAELRDLLTAVPFSRFQDRSLLDHIPLAGPLISVIGDLGIYEGNALEEWMEEMLAAKGVATFGDLRADDAELTDMDHRCQIVIADLTDRSVLVLPRDADRLGLDPDALSVARVVRASSAIPFFFEPVTLRNQLTGVDHVLVDGGLLSNFPVWLFDVLGEPQLPTFGINLVTENPRSSPIEEAPAPGVGRGRHGIIDHIRAVVGTMIEARDKLSLARADRVRTIDVPNLGIATTDFGISLERATQLFDHGAAAVDRFLETWDFDRYKAEHRIC